MFLVRWVNHNVLVYNEVIVVIRVIQDVQLANQFKQVSVYQGIYQFTRAQVFFLLHNN